MARSQKLLHELLKEDQEPFVLNKHISDKCSQMKRPFPKTCLQTRKRKSFNNKTSNFLCKNACLFSFPDATPDLRKSPLFEFTSPKKSPCKSPNSIFLHIPSRTATLLLEAALRIQKQSSPKPKAHGFGIFGSFLKRLTQRKRQIEGSGGRQVSVKWDPSVLRRKLSNEICAENQPDANVSDVGLPCSFNGRSSSAAWSESNEDKSLDMETSSSGNSDDDDSEGIHHFGNTHTECGCCHDAFCESPFHFVLQTTPSSGTHTPELLSPTRHRTEGKESDEAESVNKFESEEEEDKEQCSPVCVLEPPFEDDDEGHGNDEEEEEEEEENGYDLESSYAIVQRAKQQLLCKLRRFEKLAELDPVELEKRMLEQEEDDDEEFMEEDYHEDECSEASYKENDLRELVFEALYDREQIPEEFKKLVSDLIMEEEREMNSLEERELVIKRICKRLDLWKEVESNTIDMMIEEDFSREDGEWKKNIEQIKKMAGELELAIFGFLVEEFSEEFVC